MMIYQLKIYLSTRIFERKPQQKNPLQRKLGYGINTWSASSQ